MKNLKDLLEHQIKDLYSAETQQVDVLEKVIEKTNNDLLKSNLKKHLEETRRQKDRLENICNELEIKPTGEKCKAMEGLVKEAKDFLEEDADKEVMDAGIIAEVQRMEHYEISGYGTATRFAKELGLNSIAEKLQETLDEEYKADEKLTDLAEDRLNKKAMN